MNLTDRILTVVATATLTSAVWIVAGGSLIELADSDGQRSLTRPAEAEPSPTASVEAVEEDVADNESQPQPGLDIEQASQPNAEETQNLLIPVLNVRPADLTDTFNIAEREGSALHEALDIIAPVGTTVRAAALGTIEKLHISKAGGRSIYVRSNDRKTIHYYAHLGEFAEGLTEGQKVRRGQRLGSVGATGNASSASPHLHFAILRTTADAESWEPANAVNPYPLLTQ